MHKARPLRSGIMLHQDCFFTGVQLFATCWRIADFA